MHRLLLGTRQIMAISNLRLRSVFFDWKAWLLMLALPVAFSMLFGLMTFGAPDDQERRLQVGVISDTEQSSHLIDTLYVNIIQEYDWQIGERALILEEVRTGNLIAAIEWNEARQADAGGEVVVWKVQHAAEQMAFEARLQLHLREIIILQSMLTNINLQEQVLDKWSTTKLEINWQHLTQESQAKPTPAGTNQADEYKNSKTANNMQVQLAIGFTVMFVMMNILVSSSMLQKERTNKTWQRLLMAPLNKTKLFLGYSIGLFAIGMLQFIVLMVATSLIFDVSWGNVFLVLLLMGVFITTITALALLLASFLKSEQQQQTVGSVLVIASSMLAGIFWPLEVAPAIMQQIAIITPQYWLLEALYDVVFVGAGITAVTQAILVLTAFTVASYLLWLATVKN